MLKTIDRLKNQCYNSQYRKWFLQSTHYTFLKSKAGGVRNEKPFSVKKGKKEKRGKKNE